MISPDKFQRNAINKSNTFINYDKHVIMADEITLLALIIDRRIVGCAQQPEHYSQLSTDKRLY